MANVLHGFVENNETENVMKEISRIIKPEGILAVVEFKKWKEYRDLLWMCGLLLRMWRIFLPITVFEAMLTSEVALVHYLVKTVSKK